MAIRNQPCKFKGYIEVQFDISTRVVYQAYAPQQFHGENFVLNTGAISNGPVTEYQSFGWNIRKPTQNSLFTPAGFITSAQRFEGAYWDGRSIAMRRRQGFLATQLELFYVDQPPNVVGGVVTPAPALTTSIAAYAAPGGVFSTAYTPFRVPGMMIARPWLNGLIVDMVGFVDPLTTSTFGAFELEPDENVNNVLRAPSIISGGRAVHVYGVADGSGPDVMSFRMKRWRPSTIGAPDDWETVNLILSNHNRSNMISLFPNQSFSRQSHYGIAMSVQNWDPYPRMKNGQFPETAYFEFNPSGTEYRVWLFGGDAAFQSEVTYIPYIGQDFVWMFTNNVGPTFYAWAGQVQYPPRKYPVVPLPCYSPCIPVIDKRP